jgi:hypothetical protein
VQDTYLTPYALHKRWGGAISPKTLANWRAKGTGPKWLKVGGRIVYPLTEVKAYEERQTRSLAAIALAAVFTADRLVSSIKNEYLSAVMLGFA